MAGNLKDLLISVTAGVGKAQAGLKKVTTDLKGMGTQSKTTSSKFSRAMTTMSKSVKNFADKAQGAARKARMMGVAVGAAMTLMVKGALSYTNQIDKMSKSTGISTEALSKMAYAAEQEHASISMLEKALLNLSRVMYDAGITATNEYAIAFQKMGIAIKDVVTGELRPIEDVFADVAEAMRIATNDTERAAIAQKLFGRSGKELIPMMRLGKDAMHDLYTEAERLGLVLSPDLTSSGKFAGDQMTTLKGATRGLGLAIFEGLLPQLLTATNMLTDLAVNTRKWADENKGAMANLTLMTGGLAAMAIVSPGVIAAVSEIALIIDIAFHHKKLAMIAGVGAALTALYLIVEGKRRSADVSWLETWDAFLTDINYQAEEAVIRVKHLKEAVHGKEMMRVGIEHKPFLEMQSYLLAQGAKATREAVWEALGYETLMEKELNEMREQHALKAAATATKHAEDKKQRDRLAAREAAKLLKDVQKNADTVYAASLARLKKYQDDMRDMLSGKGAGEGAGAGAEGAAAAFVSASEKEIAALQMRIRVMDIAKSAQFLFYDEQIQAQAELTRLMDEWLVASDKERVAIEEKIRLLQISLDLQRRQREEAGLAGEAYTDIPTAEPFGPSEGELRESTYQRPPEAGGLTLEDALEGKYDAIKGMNRSLISGFDQLITKTSQWIGMLITGSGSASDAWKGFFTSLLSWFTEAIMKAIILSAVSSMFGGAMGAGGKVEGGAGKGGGIGGFLSKIGFAQEGAVTKGSGLMFVHNDELITPMNTVRKLIAAISPNVNVGGPSLAMAGGGRSMTVGELNVRLDNVANAEEMLKDISEIADTEMMRGVI